MNNQSWLWPDRTIGKRESRELREEHNRLVNSYAELLEALTEALKWHESDSWRDGDEEQQKQWEEHYNLLCNAIAKAKGE